MLVGRLTVIARTPFTVYDSFAGFAADGVKRIGIIDARDRLVEVARVINNVFLTAKPPDRVKAVVALDTKGEIIWRGGEVQLPDE